MIFVDLWGRWFLNTDLWPRLQLPTIMSLPKPSRRLASTSMRAVDASDTADFQDDLRKLKGTCDFGDYMDDLCQMCGIIYLKLGFRMCFDVFRTCFKGIMGYWNAWDIEIVGIMGRQWLHGAPWYDSWVGQNHYLDNMVDGFSNFHIFHGLVWKLQEKQWNFMRKAMVSSRSSLQPNWGAHLVMGKA